MLQNVLYHAEHLAGTIAETVTAAAVPQTVSPVILIAMLIVPTGAKTPVPEDVRQAVLHIARTAVMVDVTVDVPVVPAAPEDAVQVVLTAVIRPARTDAAQAVILLARQAVKQTVPPDAEPVVAERAIQAAERRAVRTVTQTVWETARISASGQRPERLIKRGGVSWEQ